MVAGSGAFNKRRKTGGTAQSVAEAPYAVVDSHQQEALGAAAFSPARPTGNPAISGLLVQAIGDNIRFKISGAGAASAGEGFRLIADDPPILIPIGGGVRVSFFGEGLSAVLEYQWVD